MDALDDVFKMFFYSMCDIAKYIIAIRMATNLIKQGESSDLQGIIKTLLNGSFTYGALYSVLSILDAVKEKFM